MEIVNQYGQLIGEYSRLDHDLWLTPPDNLEPFSDSNDALDCKFMSSHLHERITDLPISEYTDNTAIDSSRTISPDSVLQTRRFPIEITFVTKRARSKRCRSRKKFSRCRVYDPLFQSENHIESFSLEDTIDSCPSSAKRVRSRKISDLIQDTKSQPPATSLDGPQLEISNKCLHCDTEKTRKWRDGPLGQNTLCNACGIQYKIGLIDANDTYLPEVRSVKKPYSTLYQKNAREKRRAKSKVRKMCQHCATSVTPQWRPGPMGRSSLCNACGVQYKKGRLFPEYRPLNSPTYNPSLHSHLPKKFQKTRMRKISEEEKQTMS